MNYIDFLYLNPKICVQNNLKTYNDVHNFWINNSNTYTNIPLNQNYVPNKFQHKLYAIDNRTNINFSEINHWIKQSIGNNNINIGEYFPNLYQNVISLGTDLTSNSNTVFSYDSNFLPLSSNDSIKIISEGNQEIIGNVLSSTSNSFTTNIRIDSNTEVILYGIKIYDIERLTKIDYYNYQLSNIMYTPKNFNHKLYNLLYYQNFHDFESSYIHAELHPENSVVSVDDISSTSNYNFECNVINNIYRYAPSNDFNNIIVNDVITFKDTDITYITNDPYRKLEIVNSIQNGLITEYAIKQYIEDLILPNISQSNFHSVTSNININRFETSIIFESNITFESNINVSSNLEVDGIVKSSINRSSKYGIGTTNIVPDYKSSLSNFNANNINLTGDLYTANTTQVDGHILGSKDVSSKGAFYGARLGIGSVQFTSFNTNNTNNTDNTNNTNNTNTGNNLHNNGGGTNLTNAHIFNSIFTINDYTPYDNSIVEDLEFVSNITKQTVDSNIVQAFNTQELIVNHIGVVQQNKMVISETHISYVDVNDYIVDNFGNTYRITNVSTVDNKVTLAQTIPDNTTLYITKLLLIGKQYIRQKTLEKEMLKQIVALAKMVEHSQSL